MYPWSDDPTFRQVMQIIDPNSYAKPSVSQYELARNQLILWQVKWPDFQYLPEIEATLSLVCAALKDLSIFGYPTDFSDRLTHGYYDICTFYGMSIVKFCNLLPYYENTKNKEIHRVLKKSKKTVRDLGLALNLPTWVLECRHATCHSSNNSLVLLRKANKFCLNWIYVNYWSKVVQEKSYVETSEQNDLDKFERLLGKLIQCRNASTRKKLIEKATYLMEQNLELTIPMIVDYLVKESSDKLPETDLDLGELPLEITKAYAKLIRLLSSMDAVQSFIYQLISYFDHDDARKARISVLWFKTITLYLADNSESGEILSLPELDPEIATIVWQRLIYKASNKLTKYSPEVFEHLSTIVPTEYIPKEAMILLKQLTILGTTIKSEKSRDKSEKSKLFTFADLVNQVNPDNNSEISDAMDTS